MLQKYLTSTLQEQGIIYKWGFPSKLIIAYNSKIFIIRTEHKAKEFHQKLQDTQKRGNRLEGAVAKKK